MNGWIKLHRKLWDNPVVTKDGDHLAVWVYLLTHACHEPSDVIFHGKRYTLNVGELSVTQNQLASTLVISRSKVVRILNEFKIEQQIEQRTDHQTSIISILAWDKYQIDEQRFEQRVDNERTTSEQQNKNKINKEYINNPPLDISFANAQDISLPPTGGESEPVEEQKKTTKRFVKPTVEEVRAYCEERHNNIDAEDFVNFYESKGWVVGRSPMKDWKAAVRTWERSRKNDAPKGNVNNNGLINIWDL